MQKYKPLLDIELDGDTRDGIDVAREILAINPGLRIIGLPACAECYFPISMLEAGGRGFLSKGSSGSEVIDGAGRVAQGDLAVRPDVAHYITVNMKERTPGNQLKQLTNRKRKVLRLLAIRHAIEEAADMLNGSGKTVRVHRASMTKKHEVSTEVDLCLIALKSGIVKLHDSKNSLAESRALETHWPRRRRYRNRRLQVISCTRGRCRNRASAASLHGARRRIPVPVLRQATSV